MTYFPTNIKRCLALQILVSSWEPQPAYSVKLLQNDIFYIVAVKRGRFWFLGRRVHWIQRPYKALNKWGKINCFCCFPVSPGPSAGQHHPLHDTNHHCAAALPRSTNSRRPEERKSGSKRFFPFSLLAPATAEASIANRSAN